MTWKFDQGPDVACITCKSVIDGAPILVITHYADDDSWVFLDGQAWDPDSSLVVSMKTIVDRHPSITAIADLPPGWTAIRPAVDQPWHRSEEDFEDED